MKKRMYLYGLRIIFLLVAALVWDLLARNYGSLLMPTCLQILQALGKLSVTPGMWSALWISNQAMLLGFILASVSGIGIGFLMGRSKVAEKMFDPYLSILLVTPMSALIPIVIMATGLGLVSRIIVVFSFAFATIVINTRHGVRMVQSNWIEMSQGFGATERQIWFKILLRGASPAILTGLRLGLIRSVSGMITVELLLVTIGLGHLILGFQSNFDAAGLYATVLIIVVEAVVLGQLCQRLEHNATSWANQAVTE